MLIRYDGPHPEVVVDEYSLDETIKAGEPTEIPDDLAAKLLNQSTWSQARPITTSATEEAETTETTGATE